MMHALLATLPGRAIVAGVAVKLVLAGLRAVAGGVPAPLDLVDSLATVAIGAGGAYWLFRGPAIATRRLLWRIRRKLIISYIFVGFIPALLIAAFFLLGGLLLFSNFSSYLLQARLRSFTDRAQAIARTAALEIQRGAGSDVEAILLRRQAAAAREFPGASIAALPMDRSCGDAGPPTAAGQSPNPPIAVEGPWAHVAPPDRVPSWMTCDGFSGLLAYARSDRVGAPGAAPGLTIDGQPLGAEVEILTRALGLPDTPEPRFAVVVDLPFDAASRDALRADTGVVLVSVVAPGTGAGVLAARGGADPAPPPAPIDSLLPLNAISFLNVRDWATGQGAGTFVASMQLGLAETYEKISQAQGSIGDRSFGQGLLLLLVVIGVLFLIIASVALVTGLALARSIAGSVHELSAGTERVRRGDFGHKIAVKADDQLGELARSFNSMTASIEDLLRESAEKKRLEEELRIAHEIQMSLLPQGPLRMPGLSVTAVCVPAREVGGDYYDFFPLDEHRVGVLIADVSGKGPSAALYMAELKGLMLSLTRIHTSPRDLLIVANRIIAEHLDARSFITTTYAVIDLRAGTMTYARAGHTPLIHVPGAGVADAGVARILAPDGLVLGLKIDDNHRMFERLLREETILLRAGDLYLFFTDGITEAMNEADDCFGEQRLGRFLELHAQLPPDELRERVLRELAAFVGGAPQHDDMTMILVKIDDVAAAVQPRGVAAARAETRVG